MSRLRGAIIPVTPLQQNCTLLWDDDTKLAWVIDPGGDVPRIREAVAELGLTVERILLTHGHIDHAGGAALLRDSLPGVPIDGPNERDTFLLDDLEAQGRRFGIENARAFRPDRFLVDGDKLDLAGHHFEVLDCPGHTPGHIAFVDRADGLAIVGDVLFQNSVGRTDFPYGDTQTLLASIRDKLMVLPDETSFLCGHGPGSTIGAERRNNPFIRDDVQSARA